MAVLLSFASVIVVVHQETPGPQWWRSSLHSDTEMPCSKHEGHGDALSPLWPFISLQYFVLRFALKQPTHLPSIEISIAL